MIGKSALAHLFGRKDVATVDNDRTPADALELFQVDRFCQYCIARHGGVVSPRELQRGFAEDDGGGVTEGQTENFCNRLLCQVGPRDVDQDDIERPLLDGAARLDICCSIVSPDRLADWNML